MHTHRFVYFLIVVCLLLASCAPQTVPVTAPVAAPASKATDIAQVKPTAVLAAAVPTIQTFTTKPDDKTMARLRVSNCINGGDNVEVYFDGKKLDNGGVPISVPAPQVSGYWYLPPGKTSVTVVPAGKAEQDALIGPLDVSLEAGHRYTVVVLGQLDDKKHNSLVIDETAAYQKAGVTPTNAGHITVNNVKGSTGIDFIGGKSMDDSMGDKNVAYGAYQASLIPTGRFKFFNVIVRSATDKVVSDNSGDIFSTPGDELDCFYGDDIYHADTYTSRYNMDLSPIDFMKSFSNFKTLNDFPAGSDTHETFTQFLKLIDLAGMTDMLANGGPYLIYAPTDTAFSLLPKEKIDPYFSDPKKAAEFVKYHVIEGFYPIGSIYTRHGAMDRTLVNMLGKEIKITGRVGVNNGSVETDPDGMLLNGTRFNEIHTILIPLDQ